MKRIFALSLIGALLGAIGCTTTSKEKSYEADRPPPLEKGSGKAQVSMSPAMPEMKRRVAADDIEEGNVVEQARKLQNEIAQEKSSALNTPRR